jgi:hypothetical protein
VTTTIAVTSAAHALIGLDYSPADCAADVGSWNWSLVRTEAMKNAGGILSELTKVDPFVQISWQSYYSMVDSGGQLKPIPEACDSAVETALATINSDLQFATSSFPNVRWTDINAVLDHQPANIQSFYPSDTRSGAVPGWPHPNSAGARAIAIRIRQNNGW